MTVIPFNRRPSGPDHGDLRACECGSVWFELRAIDEAGQSGPGAVVLSREGSITGYYGLPHCRECGAPIVP